MSCTPKHHTESAPVVRLAVGDAHDRLAAFVNTMATRRSIREFSTDPVPVALVEQAVLAASRAPSGANIQPWRFVLVEDPAARATVRAAAEAEEREFYERRATPAWLDALAPLGTDATKPFLTDAPHLLVLMEVHASEVERKPYYVKESVGIALGFFLAALHHAGLATLTHTPSPMGVLTEVLGRPRNERPYVVLPLGWPADGAEVPVIGKKPLDEVLVRV
jgi:iodotyrosine deiodinase